MKFIDVDTQQSLVLNETIMPEILADECLLKVKNIGVNRADILQREGKYPPPTGESSILGLEVSGEIVKVGQAIEVNHLGKQWQLGDKVFGLVAGGGYAEYVKVKASHLIALPEQLSFEDGSACAEVFLTAYQSLFTIAALKPNSSLLIHAGASGVGSAAIQLAKAIGCYVVVTVGTDDKAQACIALGANEALNYNKVDFVSWSKEHLPSGFDVILDVVGGDYLNKNVNVAALDGQLVNLAMLAGRYSEPLDIAKLLGKRLTISGSTLRNRSDEYKTQLINNFINDFYFELVKGQIKPIIDTVYPWQQADLAHSKMKNNDNIGKLVLSI